jgi:hypothetical protein
MVNIMITPIEIIAGVCDMGSSFDGIHLHEFLLIFGHFGELGQLILISPGGLGLKVAVLADSLNLRLI